MGTTKYTKLENLDFPAEKKIPFYRRLSALSYLIYILLLSSNFAFVWLWRTALSPECIRPQLIEAPGKSAIQYRKTRLWRDLENNPYTGDPRPEFDEAWSTLVEPLVMKVSAEELHAIDGISIALADGSGFIAEIAAYHELHCVKRIRRSLNMDYYYPNMTADDLRKEKAHINHCLEYWREAAMCKGDVTLGTFEWAQGKPFSRVYSDHECVDWPRFDRWARSRMMDMTDLSVLDQTGRE